MDFKSQVGIDLHVHSTASDGSLAPTALLDLAHQLGLGALAITDHDTILGAREALRADTPPHLQVVTGVEISTAPPQPFICTGSFHILGYGIDLEHAELNHTLQTLQSARRDRNPKIVRRLQELGMDVSMSEVSAMHGDGSVGRPHIARVMLTKGYVGSIDEAFGRYLGRGQAAYVEKYRIACDSAIELITDAGGVAVLAHPSLLVLDEAQSLEALVTCLQELGLAGLEVYYPEHSPAETAAYKQLARRHNMVITGGTDFHGSLKPEIQLGIGTGQFHVPFKLYENLAQRLDRSKQGI